MPRRHRASLSSAALLSTLALLLMSMNSGEAQALNKGNIIRGHAGSGPGVRKAHETEDEGSNLSSIEELRSNLVKYLNDTRNAQNDSIEPDPKIVRGRDARRGRFPYYSRMFGDVQCGAALIAPDVVITAAHCNDPVGETSRVQVSLYDLNDYGGPAVNWDTFTQHPDWSTTSNPRWYFDVALVKLERPVDAPLIRINTDENVPIDNQRLTLLGFGSISDDDGDPVLGIPRTPIVLPTILQETQGNNIALDTCKFMDTPDTPGLDFGDPISGGSIISDELLCTMEFLNGNPRSGTCRGDSGGPVILEGDTFEDDVYIGTTTGAVQCVDRYLPDIAVRTSFVSDWIIETGCNMSVDPPDYWKCPNAPTAAPSKSPTAAPVVQPTESPTRATSAPTKSPTASPTSSPTRSPTAGPTSGPTATPVIPPTSAPTATPTTTPTNEPTQHPSTTPSAEPTTSKPTSAPTSNPTSSPSARPTQTPSEQPTSIPSSTPTSAPTSEPTNSPSTTPTNGPTGRPTSAPSMVPSASPSMQPTNTVATNVPSSGPSSSPTILLATSPSQQPTGLMAPATMQPNDIMEDTMEPTTNSTNPAGSSFPTTTASPTSSASPTSLIPPTPPSSTSPTTTAAPTASASPTTVIPPMTGSSSSPTVTASPTDSTPPTKSPVVAPSASISPTMELTMMPTTAPVAPMTLPPTTDLVQISVLIFFDDNPQQTGWSISDTKDPIQFQQAVLPGFYEPDAHAALEHVFLERGQQYTFTITDSGGDGFCCRTLHGVYNVAITGSRLPALASGFGNFGSSETSMFTVPMNTADNPSSPFSKGK